MSVIPAAEHCRTQQALALISVVTTSKKKEQELYYRNEKHREDGVNNILKSYIKKNR